MQHPNSPKSDVTDTYFGVTIPDPYRWLEALDSPETAAWVTAQNEVTFGYLSQIPFRDKIRERLTEIWNYERYGVPEQVGDDLVFSKNDGLQNQAVLYRQRGDNEPEVLLDPNKFSADGTTALAGLEFSNDHRYLAYATSSGGSDWNQVRILDLTTNELLPDELNWVKVSGTSWANNGFYYSRYDAPNAGDNDLSGKNEFHKVYFHQLNTPQSADQLVYENPKMALGFRIAGITEDERFLSLYLTDGLSDGNRLLVRDLSDPAQADRWTTLVESYEFSNTVIGNVGGEVLVYTNYQAPRFRVVRIDPTQPQEANWREVLPETENKLESVSHVGGRLMAGYLHDASSQVKVYSELGEFQHDVQLPAIGTASG
ncbi:MAG TPA: S9 family peptidase, partial [Hymenobacter sp.]